MRCLAFMFVLLLWWVGWVGGDTCTMCRVFFLFEPFRTSSCSDSSVPRRYVIYYKVPGPHRGGPIFML